MSSQAMIGKAKHLFQHLFEKASLGIAVEDFEGNLLLANPALCAMLGYSEKEMCGMNCSQFASSEDSQDDWALFEQLQDGRIDHYSIEKRYQRKDGSQIWGWLSVSLLKDGEDGSPLVFAFVEDITERKRAEHELTRSNEMLRLALDAGQTMGWEYDLEEGRESWFGNLKTTFGIDSDFFSGRNEDFYRCVHADDRQYVMKAELEARKNRTSYAAEFRIVGFDGIVRWVAAEGRFHYGSNGDPQRLFGIATNITGRKQAEEALKKSEEKFAKAFRQSPMGLALTSAIDHRYIDVNETFERQTGWRREDVIGRTPFDIGIWVDPAERVNFVRRLLAEGSIRDLEVRLRMRDDRILVALLTAESIELNGEPCIITVAANVTERKHAEEARRESDDKLRLLLDSTAEAIFGIDLEQCCTFCNRACLSILGYERVEEVLGKNMHTLMHHTRLDGTAFPAADCRVYRMLRTGERAHADDEVLWRANGTSFPAEYWSYPQRRGEELVGAVVAFVDITQRKLAETAIMNVNRKLIEAQEQERSRIGRELHDDIGQRLALLAVELEQLGTDFQSSAEITPRVGELRRQTLEIAADIQSLSHELHSAKLQYLGIAVAMRGFCQEFAQQQKVEIDFQAQDLPSSVSPDISLCLFRVLQETLHNSAKHSGGKHFQVRLSGSSDEIQLTAVDFGVGFDCEVAKASPGLGLISMEERLKLVNGTLSIQSKPNTGTTVHARAPLRA
jgi:PAS domain S-box-containing protein